jgi:hypothetical protein
MSASFTPKILSKFACKELVAKKKIWEKLSIFWRIRNVKFSPQTTPSWGLFSYNFSASLRLSALGFYLLPFAFG